jgi:carbon storage regulator
MLVLTRKAGEKLVIGESITVTVLEVIGNRVRLGLEAPADVPILRSELAGSPELDARVPPPTGGLPPLRNTRRAPAALDSNF